MGETVQRFDAVVIDDIAALLDRVAIPARVRHVRAAEVRS